VKLLFINPSLRPEAPNRYLPVGLGYVVTAVEQAGYRFDLLDIDIGRYSDSYVENFIREGSYDVIAFGAIVSHYKWCKWLIGVIKHHSPQCRVIVGNSVGGSIPEVLFAHTEVDIVIKGEADRTIVEVLGVLRDGGSLGQVSEPLRPWPHTNGNLPPCYEGTGVPGIVFRDAKGRLVFTGHRKAVAKIDSLPFPNWDLFDVQAYFETARTMVFEPKRYPRDKAVVMPVNTARGCVFKCTFCHYVFWNDPYRHRSAQSVIGEIRRNQEKWGANYICFWDELSFHKLGPAETFIDELIEADLGIHWMGAVRSDLFGRSDIPRADRLRAATKFVESGCLALGYSLESGNEEILKAMNKRVKAEFFGEQVDVLREAGIVSNTSLVIGYPQETEATIRETLDMCRRFRVYPSVGFLLPLPETGMWAYAVDNGFIKDADAFLSGVTERQDIVLNLTQMTDEQILAEVHGGLKRMKEEFGLDLGDNLIRTGGYTKHNRHQDVQTHRNTVDSLNYSRVSG